MRFDDAFANSKYLADGKYFPSRWAKKAADFRVSVAGRGRLGVAYGAGERQWFDLFLPEGQDPDDLLKAQGAGAVQKVVAEAQPLSDMLWARALEQNDRATPERRAQFERELRNLINEIRDDTVKKHYLADVAERLQALVDFHEPELRLSVVPLLPKA